MLMSRGERGGGSGPDDVRFSSYLGADKQRGDLTFVIGEMSRLLRLLNSERAVFNLTLLSLLSRFVIKINWVSLLIGIKCARACGPPKLILSDSKENDRWKI